MTNEHGYRKARDVAPELGYTNPDSFIRRWKELGYPWMKSGRIVMLANRDISKFIRDNTTQRPTTPHN